MPLIERGAPGVGIGSSGQKLKLISVPILKVTSGLLNNLYQCHFVSACLCPSFCPSLFCVSSSPSPSVSVSFWVSISLVSLCLYLFFLSISPPLFLSVSACTPLCVAISFCNFISLEVSGPSLLVISVSLCLCLSPSPTPVWFLTHGAYSWGHIPNCSHLPEWKHLHHVTCPQLSCTHPQITGSPLTDFRQDMT